MVTSLATLGKHNVLMINRQIHQHKIAVILFTTLLLSWIGSVYAISSSGQAEFQQEITSTMFTVCSQLGHRNPEEHRFRPQSNFGKTVSTDVVGFPVFLGPSLQLEASKSANMVSFKIPAGATAQEIEQMRQYAALSNNALNTGYLSPTGRVSTAGALRLDANAAAKAERVRAAAARTPYVGHAGHVPDATWTGQAIPYTWLDLSPKINMSLGSQAAKYLIGFQPSGFQVVP